MACMEHSCNNKKCEFDFTINNNLPPIPCPECGYPMYPTCDELPEEPEIWDGDTPKGEPDYEEEESK